MTSATLRSAAAQNDSRTCTPMGGFFPLASWAGFAVLCGWAALTLAAAACLLRRDA